MTIGVLYECNPFGLCYLFNTRKIILPFLKHYDLTEAIIVQILSHLKIWFHPELKKSDFKQIQVTS
jgi:hypothetical protein